MSQHTYRTYQHIRIFWSIHYQLLFTNVTEKFIGKQLKYTSLDWTCLNAKLFKYANI